MVTVYMWSLSVHGVVVSEVIPSVAPNALQTSARDEQLVSIGGEIALSRNTPPPRDVEVATQLARDSDPSLALRSSNHDHIRRFNDPFWFHNLSILHSRPFCASIAMLHPSTRS